MFYFPGSLLVEVFVEEAPRKELLFALKKVSLANLNSTLGNSIKDCITIIVFFIEGFLHFKAATLRKLH